MKDSNHYHFITRWQLQATPEEVYAILDEPEELVRWWPAVYQEVEVLGHDREGSANEYALNTKGWLPYSLQWDFRTVRKVPPHRLTLEASGDFAGIGVWRIIANGDVVDVTYDWRIRAEKPLLRYFSFLLKPLFSANHHWAMKKGEESIQLELERRRVTTPEERAKIPLPPGPVPEIPFWAAGGILAVLGLMGISRILKRNR